MLTHERTSVVSAAELPKKHASTNPNLDFLRAVAVMLVVVDHTMLAFHRNIWHGLDAEWMGLAGVWMFFVHTALVLMWSLERRPYTLDFYIRRIFRIYPLIWVAIAVIVLTHARVTGYGHDLFDYTPFSKGNLLATSLLVYNLVPFVRYTPIEYVIWSLPLEVDMYVLLPVLFAFARRDRRLTTLLLGWALAAAVAFPYAQGMQFLTAIPNFLPGIMAFLLFKRIRPRAPFWTFPLYLLVLLFAVLQVKTVASGWVFCLSLGLALPFFVPVANRAVQSAAHLIAKYSYGVYIVHPFALLLGVFYLHGHGKALQLTTVLAVIVVGSIAAYHLVEEPMIRVGSRFAARTGVSVPMEAL